MAKYIGLMSGTSMDAVDAVLCDIEPNYFATLGAVSLPYAEELLTKLQTLCAPSSDEISLLGQTDRLVGEHFAKSVRQLLDRYQLNSNDIVAIGSHGQTIRHLPQSANQQGFSLQIGDANTIASITGIDVIADFRRKDIALGGQGAPLVPVFHKAQFHHPLQNRVIINIGGIANVTILAAKDKPVLGFDTGPGNTLMDQWILKHLQQPYDSDGKWSSAGKINAELLAALLDDPFFALPAPKSTGREYFNLPWLDKQLSAFAQLPPQDVQATLVELTAVTIARSISPFSVTNGYVCGGGVRNQHLMNRLALHLAGIKLCSTASLNIDPQWVEGAAFAWLAYAFVNKQTGNVPSVTGASRAAVLGGLYPAN